MSRRQTRGSALSDASSLLQSSLSSSSYTSSAMYMNSQFNHPAFNKLYIGAHATSNGKTSHHSIGSNAVPKAPKAPEKPLMPYMRYSRKVWDEVKASQPDLKLWEIGKIIGKMWRELPSGDKQLFVDEYDAEKIEYQEQLKSYHNSPAYQVYLQAKGRAEMLESSESRMDREDSYMSIEPADDDGGDNDDGFSVKHIAAARFQRNHRLMQDILQDTSIIPSGRNIVTQKRLDTLREQVQSLEHHQDKLQKELQMIEKTHDGTKRKWKDQTSKFRQEMKRLRSMTPQEYYQEYKKMHAQKKMEAAAAAATASNASDNNNKNDKKSQESNMPQRKLSTDSSLAANANKPPNSDKPVKSADSKTSDLCAKTPLLQKELSVDMETEDSSAQTPQQKPSNTEQVVNSTPPASTENNQSQGKTSAVSNTSDAASGANTVAGNTEPTSAAKSEATTT